MKFKTARAIAIALILPMIACVFPHITYTPNNLDFRAQVITPGGGSSAAQTVTVKNSGTGKGNVGPFTASGAYSVSSNCPASLAAQTSCTLDVAFAPNAMGTIQGEIFSNGNAVIALTGQGVAPVSVSPASLDFKSVNVGGMSTAQAVTLTNNQSTAAIINSVLASGDYSQQNNCPASLAAGASCTLNVRFAPSVAGAVPGAVTISTDATLPVQPVGLAGVGSGSATSVLSFSSATVSFGNQEAGSSSAAQAISVTNSSGASSLTINTVAVSGGYNETDNCAGKMIAPGGSCTITAKFQPTADFASVPYPGAITITDSDTTSPHVIGLSGTSSAAISVSPAALYFGNTLNGGAAPQRVTFTNIDSGPETLNLALPAQNPLANNTCNNPIPSGGKCTVDVGFTGGGTKGAMEADFSSGGFLNPKIVNLSGCMSPVDGYPASFNFGAPGVGQTSATETLTLIGGPIAISNITITGPAASDYAITNNTCAGTIASGSSCTVDLTLTPSAAGTRGSALNIADDQSCSPQVVNLNGGASVGPFLLTGSVEGSGGFGNVTSAPAGMDCSGGSPCSATFSSGTHVSVSETPDPDSNFAGWSGACSGMGSCSFIMNADAQVVANFVSAPATPDFSLDVSPSTSATIAAGGAATFTIGATALNGFSSMVALSCAAPTTATGMHCSVNPASIGPGSNSTLTVTTVAPNANLLLLQRKLGPIYALWLPIGGLLLGSKRFRRQSTKRKASLLTVAGIFIGLALESACGGGSSRVTKKAGGTPPGTYTVSINAISGAIQHPTAVTVTVQ